MKKNFFEEIYETIQKASAAYDNAVDEAGQKTARALYKQTLDGLEDLSATERRIWNYYETSRNCGNELIDIDDTIRDSAVEDLIEGMRSCGIDAFTFSSGWSSAVETAWLFQKAGCTLAGLVEINSHHKIPYHSEYEKVHGYLFKVN